MDRDGILVIGYGSPLRGDDAAGPLAARLLAQRGFEAIEAHQLTPELAEKMAEASVVIFLDAHAGLAPGEVSVETLTATPETGSGLEHAASPAGLLRLARTVYGAEPLAWLIGMGGSNFEVSDQVSASAQKAVERAVEEVILIREQSQAKPPAPPTGSNHWHHWWGLQPAKPVAGSVGRGGLQPAKPVARECW